MTSTEQTKIFSDACKLLGLTPSKDAKRFGVTRQTFSRWMRGESKPKPEAFMICTRILTDTLDMTIEASDKKSTTIQKLVEVLSSMGR